MQIQIILDPTLDLSSDDFVAGWNADPATQQLATAEVRQSKSPHESFPIDPKLIHDALIFLAGMAGDIAIDLLKEQLKTYISDFLTRKRKNRKPTLRVEQARQPNGAILLIVHEEKA